MCIELVAACLCCWVEARPSGVRLCEHMLKPNVYDVCWTSLAPGLIPNPSVHVFWNEATLNYLVELICVAATQQVGHLSGELEEQWETFLV